MYKKINCVLCYVIKYDYFIQAKVSDFNPHYPYEKARHESIYPYTSDLGREGLEDVWGSMVSQVSQINKLQISERHHLKDKVEYN